MNKTKNTKIFVILFICLSAMMISVCFAKDTDIYSISTKQNCYILMDNSGSMDFGVYEHTIDYHKMFQYLFKLDADGGNTAYGDKYIYDTVMHSDYFYTNSQTRRQIYLWKGAIGVTVAQLDGVDMAFTGDAADPGYLWYSNNLVDTHTVIDNDGNLTDDGSGEQRLTVDGDGYILLDGQHLPLGQNIKLHDLKELYDGSIIDNGFGGLLNAPGYYFSGYEGVTENNLDTAEGGDTNVYFFVTGNWANMQAMYNLHYVTNNPTPTGAQIGDFGWKYEVYPIAEGDWPLLVHTLDYPTGNGNYEDGLSENESEQIIEHPGAKKIQIHFFYNFDVEGDGDINTWSNDYVVLKNSKGTDVIKYDNDNNPMDVDGWSEVVDGDTVKICLESNADTNGLGYSINKIRVVYDANDTAAGYLMQNRLDVAKDAMLYTLDAFYGKMNWGFASFKNGDGATLHHSLNPNLSDDVNNASITTHVNGLEPQGGTPLGEALQDVFQDGYYTKRHSLDNLICRKNYIISVSDGFPSVDEGWSRIGGKVFTDEDNDGWTADPYQYKTPPPNYYDDVAHWIYTHSWVDDDKREITDPANSYSNVTTHHIAFGAKHPLMIDAAGESGGEYITAYNKSQLVAAFYALALQMTEAVSFTSPVVSVDAANKIQNGDDLYLGLFLPQDSKTWIGNIKKFRLGNQSGENPWMVYDGADNEAIDSTGAFLDNTAAFWADDNDDNDTDNYGGSDVTEDGVGEVLLERIKDNFNTSTYYNRNIKTYNTATHALGLFDRDAVTKEDLGVPDTAARDALINYIYGYTYEADASGNPLGTRGWILGSIIHSRPIVIDYYDADSNLDKRYIAVGANDGMLHIFDDATGQEIFAFIPPEMLPKLQRLPLENMVDTVDGFVSLYRKDSNPKYLIFGERRGGGRYWSLDIANSNPANWTVAWLYENSEISQSWSEPKFATIPTAVNSSTGEHTFKDVMIISGGYDAEEDNYPEPFNDPENSGSPYNDNDTIDKTKWDPNKGIGQDVNSNGIYDLYNLDKNENGRGVFILDIDDPNDAANGVKYSISYNAAGSALEQGMKWCFPATPSVITKTYSYNQQEVINGKSVIVRKLKTSVLKTIYATDIYANIYKIDFDFEVEYDSSTSSWTIADQWGTKKIFSSNPGCSGNVVDGDGNFTKGTDDSTRQGLKAFYSPAVSWRGACNYFDAVNYYFSNTEFKGINDIAAIYFGTGDREHPIYTMKQNRFYAVYDDSSITADDINDTPVTVSTYPYSEKHLLNLTCNELGDGTTLTGTLDKDDYKIALLDDAVNNNALENGTEDDAKGWYIILEYQGDSIECSHCSYEEASPDQNHDWEKVLSRVKLFAGILYFTTYQPDMEDVCNPNGNAFSYAINYCNATAAYNFNSTNNDGDVTDRYNKVTDILGIPSDFAIIIRDGEAGAMSMMGGKMIGPGGGGGGDNYKIKSPGLGLDLYYWFEGNNIE